MVIDNIDWNYGKLYYNGIIYIQLHSTHYTHNIYIEIYFFIYTC